MDPTLLMAEILSPSPGELQAAAGPGSQAGARHFAALNQPLSAISTGLFISALLFFSPGDKRLRRTFQTVHKLQPANTNTIKTLPINQSSPSLELSRFSGMAKKSARRLCGHEIREGGRRIERKQLPGAELPPHPHPPTSGSPGELRLWRNK